MKLLNKVSLGILTVVDAAIDSELSHPPDFNITKALLNNGVNIYEIPGLVDLAGQSSLEACSIACNALKMVFGEPKVSSKPPETYWSRQQSIAQPKCTFSPDTASDVSTLVLLARLTQCRFAVKSGGHAAFSGASSIKGGITVDLANMKKRKLSADKKIIAIGPGNRWLDVYDHLTPYDLAVVGGRAASVGVGGLTLGGGISHHTNQYGLACDNVASYELVTSSGSIINVSQDTYPDLFWALRGGGNNFGIVTTFNYETLPQGLMFSSKRRYNTTYLPNLLEAFVNAVSNAEQDTKLAHFISAAYFNGTQIATTEYEYFTPVDPSNPPDILKEYLAIPTLQQDSLNTTLANTTHGLTESMPAGFRTTMWSHAYKLSGPLMKRMSEYFFNMAPEIPALVPSISFQAFSTPALRAMRKKGGNTLGLDANDGPLFHVLFYASWTDEASDGVIMGAAQKYIDACIAMAKEMGAYHGYMYMPYSSPYQDVVSGYGAANVERLKAVAKKYDPLGVFEKLQPGYFKLEGAPFGRLTS